MPPEAASPTTVLDDLISVTHAAPGPGPSPAAPAYPIFTADTDSDGAPWDDGNPLASASYPGHLDVAVVDPDGPEGPAPAQAVFQAWLVPEGFATDDGRWMAPGSLSARLERLPLMASDRNLPAHLQAEFIGNLMTFSRAVSADGVSWFVAAVDFDSDESAVEWQRMVEEDRIRGVSVDLIMVRGRVKTGEGDLLDAETGEPADDQSWPADDSVWLVVDEGLIAGATMVPMPAFRDARVEPVDQAVAAAALPTEWFTLGEFERPVRASVFPLSEGTGGRLLGHGAAWGTCLVGHPPCILPPASNTDYALARRVPSPGGLAAPIYWQPDGDLYSHAPVDLPWWEAISWYEKNCQVVGMALVSEDLHGIRLAGYCGPQLLSRHLSGDWRPYDPGHELIGWSIVNKPGFPVPAAVAAALASGRAIVGSAEPCDCPDGAEAEVMAPQAAAGPVEAGTVEERLGTLTEAVVGLAGRLDGALGMIELEWARYQSARRVEGALAPLEPPLG